MTTALVLSGGGSNGDWEVGAIRGMAGLGVFPQGVDIFVGTSIGAINGAFLAQYNRDRFVEGADDLGRVWFETIAGKTSDIWRPWWPAWLGLLRYLPALWKPSIGHRKPAEHILSRTISWSQVATSDVELMVNGVDLRTGKHHVWHKPHVGMNEVLASSSYPIAMPPVEFDGGYWTDGGIVDMAMVAQAIRTGADRVVVLATRDPHGPGVEELGPESTTLEVGNRIMQLMVLNLLGNDIDGCRRINGWLERGQLSDPRYRPVDLQVLYPRERLGDPLEFTAEKIKRQMDQGFEDALAYWDGLAP